MAFRSRRHILQMLSEGTIDVDQAEELLNALEPAANARATEGSSSSPGPGFPQSPVTSRSAGGERLGFKLSVEQLVELAANDIDARYVREMSKVGLQGLTFEQLVQLGANDVQPAWVRGLVEAGLEDIGFDQAIELANNDVDPGYVRSLRGAGFRDLTVADVIELSCNDVEVGYVRALVAAGLTDLRVDEVIELASNEVDPGLILVAREAAEH